jgi:hypothetical protein
MHSQPASQTLLRSSAQGWAPAGSGDRRLQEGGDAKMLGRAGQGPHCTRSTGLKLQEDRTLVTSGNLCLTSPPPGHSPQRGNVRGLAAARQGTHALAAISPGTHRCPGLCAAQPPSRSEPGLPATASLPSHSYFCFHSFSATTHLHAQARSELRKVCPWPWLWTGGRQVPSVLLDPHAVVSLPLLTTRRGHRWRLCCAPTPALCTRPRPDQTLPGVWEKRHLGV